MPGLLDIGGRVAIVTGCSKGIGAGVSEVLVRHGATVVGLDVDPWPAADAVQRHFRACDLAQPDQVAATIAGIAAEFGRVDILVNNAAVTRVVDFFDLAPDDIDRIIDVNFRGNFTIMQAVARLMAAGDGGAIVNMSSVAAKGYRKTTNVIYAATKAALVNLTRQGAARLGPHGIRVNAICPGPTQTDIMSAWVRDTAAARGVPEAEVLQTLTGESALGTINTPEDIGNLVLFLVSDAARTITGQSVNIDGGLIWD